MHIALTPSFEANLAAFFHRLQGTLFAPAHAQTDSTHTLVKGKTMSLPDARAVQLHCLQGSLWLTHDGDCKDLVLEAGQSYQAERGSRLLVYALSSASLRLQG